MLADTVTWDGCGLTCSPPRSDLLTHPHHGITPLPGSIHPRESPLDSPQNHLPQAQSLPWVLSNTVLLRRPRCHPCPETGANGAGQPQGSAWWSPACRQWGHGDQLSDPARDTRRAPDGNQVADWPACCLRVTRVAVTRRDGPPPHHVSACLLCPRHLSAEFPLH